MTRSRSLTLALLLALTACDDGSSPSNEEDGGEILDEDQAAAHVDGGGRRDAGRPGAVDGGSREDPSDEDASVPNPDALLDAGRNRKDAAVSAGADSAVPSSSDVVPAGEHCASVANFDATAVAFEEEVLKLTNEARAIGADCHSKGKFGPTMPLKMQPNLRCSARLHSAYMASSGTFDHDVPAGTTPFTRMKEAGYAGSNMGENIAAGYATPKLAVDGWLKSDGHCSNMMSPSFTEIGVGYVDLVGKPPAGSYSEYWTQNFGARK